jgi:hypothetical protein
MVYYADMVFDRAQGMVGLGPLSTCPTAKSRLPDSVGAASSIGLSLLTYVIVLAVIFVTN